MVNPIIRIAKFITRKIKSGIRLASWKYLNVESKTTLIIDAKSPLNVTKNKSAAGINNNPKKIYFLYLTEAGSSIKFITYKYARMLIISKNTDEIISSTGDLTIPHPNADEKFAASTRGPVIRLEGNPTMNITALKTTQYKIKSSNLSERYLIELNSFLNPNATKNNASARSMD
jgi:hypothetical protein